MVVGAGRDVQAAVDERAAIEHDLRAALGEHEAEARAIGRRFPDCRVVHLENQRRAGRQPHRRAFGEDARRIARDIAADRRAGAARTRTIVGAERPPLSRPER